MKKLFLLLTWLLALPIGMLAQGTSGNNATTITSGGSGSGTLDKDNSDAWFKIDVPEEGTVTLNITSGGDLSIQYVDFCRKEGDNYWMRQNIFPGSEGATLKVTDAGKDTYYIHVHRGGGAGSYSVEYQFSACSYANDAEQNDVGGQGSMLVSGQTVQGRMGYLDGENYRDVDDWYKLEVPQDGTVRLIIDPNQDNELSIQYVDFCRKDGDNYWMRQNSFTGQKKDTLTVTDAGVGTYYVHIHRANGHGGYSLRYDFIPNTYANDTEPNDEPGQGSMLESGKTVEGHLGYLDAVNYRDVDDWYKLEVPQDGTVRMIIDPNQDNELSIQYVDFCRKDGDNYWMRQNSFTGQKKDTLTVTDAGVGTYYVHIHRANGHGGYSLRYDFIPNTYANDTEPNDEPGQGSMLENGKTVEGHLGYLDGENYRDVDDWYKLEVPRDGTVRLILDPNQDNELSIQFVDFCRKDGDNYWMRQNSFTGQKKDTLTVTDAGVGTYYLRIHRGGGHGGYKLRYEFTPNKFIGDDEPNNTAETANQTLTDGMSINAHLGYLDGDNYRDLDDWYKIEIPKAGGASIVIVPEQEYGLSIQYVDFCRKDGDNYWMVKNMFPGQQADTLYVGNLSQGSVYWLRVHRGGGHGGYTVKYNFEPIAYMDDEPNDEYTQAVDIANGQSKVGNLGFLKGDSSVDEDDWYKTTIEDGQQLLISYVPDLSESLDATLSLYYNGMEERIMLHYDQGGERSGYDAWAHLQSLNIQTDENLKGGTYYLKVHRNSGTGQYKITIGTPARSLGSDIRVHYTGWPAVRKGVPAPFTVTVENISSEPSCSFWLSMSYTDDIKLLYAELPTPNGTQHLDISDMGDEQYHNALLLFPGLRPYEKYSFNVWAEGYVEGKYDARGEKKIIGTATTLLVVGAITGIVTSMAKDRVEDLMQDYTYKYVQDKETAERYNRAYGTTMEDIKLKRDKYNIMAHGMTTVAQQVGEKVAGMVPGGATAASVAQTVGTVKKFADPVRRRFMVKYGRAAFLDDLMDEILDEKPCINNTVSSFDPNEMVGPAGHGDENYIGETQTMNYRIMFENKAEATAPAYRIRISDVLDENVFDVSSVRFGGTSHDNAGFGWKMNRDGNKLSWDIEGIELPPNKTAPEGEGYVDFSVDLKPGLANKAKISNKATIIFDYNDPIETNVYVNTLDLVAPITKMVSATTGGGKVVVSCSGSDDESGVGHYKFFVSENGGDFEQFADKYEPQVTFDIPAGGKAENYKFYAVAIDNVGNVQTTPPDAIAPSAGTAGDANGDGTINAADIVEVVNYIMGSPSDKFNAVNADANGDGTVNAADIVTIVNIIMGN